MPYLLTLSAKKTVHFSHIFERLQCEQTRSCCCSADTLRLLCRHSVAARVYLTVQIAGSHWGQLLAGHSRQGINTVCSTSTAASLPLTSCPSPNCCPKTDKRAWAAIREKRDPLYEVISNKSDTKVPTVLLMHPQEDTSSQRIVDQQDPASLASTEVAALPSPRPQVLEQKEEDSKRESVDEEWLKSGTSVFEF